MVITVSMLLLVQNGARSLRVINPYTTTKKIHVLYAMTINFFGVQQQREYYIFNEFNNTYLCIWFHTLKRVLCIRFGTQSHYTYIKIQKSHTRNTFFLFLYNICVKRWKQFIFINRSDSTQLFISPVGQKHLPVFGYWFAIEAVFLAEYIYVICIDMSMYVCMYVSYKYTCKHIKVGTL